MSFKFKRLSMLNSRSNSSESTSLSPNTKISNVQIEIKKHKKNDVLDFLILLHPKDYQKKLHNWYNSIYDRLYDNADLFPGNVILISYADFFNENNKNKYFIEGNVLVKHLYIRLPKEDLFITANSFQERYLNSKINELINIFVHLKPKKIVVSIDQENAKSLNISATLGGLTPVGSISSGVNIESDSNRQVKILKQMEFDPDSSPVDPNYFKNEYKFYYLAKEDEWLELIRKRLKHKLSNEKYVYSYKDQTHFKTKLTSKLQILDVEISYDTSKYDNLKIFYEVEYFPLDDDYTIKNNH